VCYFLLSGWFVLLSCRISWMAPFSCYCVRAVGRVVSALFSCILLPVCVYGLVWSFSGVFSCFFGHVCCSVTRVAVHIMLLRLLLFAGPYFVAFFCLCSKVSSAHVWMFSDVFMGVFLIFLVMFLSLSVSCSNLF
jgi:hypothetical protein